MYWHSLFVWLVQSAIASTVLLGLAALGVRLSRSPADRVRVIQCGLAAALIAMIVCAIPQFRLVTVPMLAASTPEPGVAAPPDQSRAPSIADRPLRGDSPAIAPEPMVTIEGQLVSHHLPSAASTASDEPAVTSSTQLFLADYLVRSVCIAYLVGIALLLLRWCVARWGLVRLARLAQPALPVLQAELARLDPRTRRVRLLVSDRVSAPVTWGIVRPVIIIPASAVEAGDMARLRYYLAHEWAHVARRDAATWQLATIAQAIFFYQPLVHWLGHQLSLSMDQLADTQAAEQGESTTDYAELLIGLARMRLGGTPLLTLSIVDRRSAIFQRVTFLLREAASVRRSTSLTRSLVMISVALAATLGISAVRLDAQDAGEPDKAKETAEVKTEKPQPEPEKQAVEPITYTGIVTDAATGLPIKDVTVLVYHKLSRDPKTGGWSDIETTEHKTNMLGVYSFTLPSEQVAESSLYLEVDTRHPKYANMGRGGYSHDMIRKNLKMGEVPWFTKISLWPAEEVTARVVDPEGKPLEGVEIRSYTAAEKATGFPRGSFGKTETDAEGRFSMVVATPGDGVLWIVPSEHSPQAVRLKNRRGDFGTIEVARGADVKGRLLDAEGKPFGKVRVEARRSGDGEEADEFLQTNAVSNGIRRVVSVDETGEFTLPSLPDGKYSLEVQADSDSYDPTPLDEVFFRPTFLVENGQAEELTIRAAPYVVLSGTYLNSKGEPRAGHQVTVFGHMNGERYYSQSSAPKKDGKFTLKIPHGLENAQLDLMTNEHSSLRWRMSPEAPLERGRRVKIGIGHLARDAAGNEQVTRIVEDDINGFQIIRYEAPVLLARAINENGKPLAGCEPVLTYENAEVDEMTVYSTGSHVHFEQQNDGRHRSSQLLPDEPFKITMKKEGYTAEAKQLTLKEGEERVVTIALKNAAE